MRHHRRYEREAFTLLEVMLVLGILAMLALFVVPKFIQTGERAKIRAAESMVGSSGNLATAIALFHQEIGQYPEELVDLFERPSYIDDDDKRWYQFYPEANFKDPWGNDLVYKYPGEVKEDSYDLLSMGPDGEEDSEDDITNYPQER